MNELISKLKASGFTEYESKVFLALLQGKLMSASEIAESARIIRTDVYKILRAFVKKGFCNEIETNTILKYEIIDPDIIFDKIEHRINFEKENEVKSLKEIFKELKPLYKSKYSEDEKELNVELIRGYNQHREVKFIKIFKNAKKEVLFMTKPEYLVSDEVDGIAVKFIKNGGVIKSVYQASDDFKLKTKEGWKQGTLEDLIKTVTGFEKYGEQVRINNSTVPNITIFDRQTVYINVIDKTVPKHNEADIITRNKPFAESMVTVFDAFWEKSFSVNEFKKKFIKKENI
ncbi:MAG TPA: helix-turn-helix domain-containing protein [Ignavibacteria bacterium]